MMSTSLESSRPGKRLLLATFGSLGDLHPYIAVGLELKRRGHQPIIATSGYYRSKVEALGLGFHAVRPDFPTPEEYSDVARRVMHPTRGPEIVIRELFMPRLRETYDDLDDAARSADLLVGHVLTFPMRLVAEKRGIPWISSVLAPLSMFSFIDPPAVPVWPSLPRYGRLGRMLWSSLFRLVRPRVAGWAAPWHKLRAELGLPPTTDNPIFEGQHSPRMILALFSQVFGPPQPDWPPGAVVTGFPFYDHDDDTTSLSPQLERFLDAGDPPLIFTLGSSAVHTAGRFYLDSIAATQALGRRAVLLVGRKTRQELPDPLPPGILAVDYAPFSLLLPRGAATIHQGGVGTTAQALRAGRPMLVVPFAHDQFDNAWRAERRGVARQILATRYNARRAKPLLADLLTTPAYSARAAEIGRQIHTEHGALTAADAIESIL